MFPNNSPVCNFITQVAAGSKKPGEKVTSEGIDVALNPEEIDDLGAAAMQAKYDQTLKEQQSQLEKEDLSDMVAEHAAKQKVCDSFQAIIGMSVWRA